MKTQPFTSDQRLKHRREFQAVFNRRWSFAGPNLVVYGLPNNQACNRLGLSVGKRLGNAIRRNRFKRLCREAFRTTATQQPIGWDWIVLPRLPRKRGISVARIHALTLDDVTTEFLEQVSRLSRKFASEINPPDDVRSAAESEQSD